MALKPCPHCGHSVSDQATKCPQCGKDPRFTPDELERQERQRKKKHKAWIVSLAAALAAAVVALCIIYIPRYAEYRRNLDAYNAAQELFNAEEYPTAILAYEELGDFKDSRQKALDARYKYIISHKSRSDGLTADYIRKLQSVEYPQIDDVYKELYAWKVQTYPCTDKEGQKSKYSFVNGDPLYFFITFSGGEPDATIRIKYAVTKFNGASSTTDNNYFRGQFRDGDTAWVGWDKISSKNCTRIKIVFYDRDTGEQLAGAVADIKSGYASTAKPTSTATTPVYTENVVLPDDMYTDIVPTNTGDSTDGETKNTERTVRIYNEETGQWEWVSSPEEKPSQEKETTTKKKQIFVRQYNHTTGQWEWMWVDDD